MSSSRGLKQDHLTIIEKLQMISWPFILLLTMVTCIGLVSLYSAAGGSMEPWAMRQGARYIFGVGCLILVALVDIRIWMKLAYPFYVLCIMLLVYVDIKGHVGMGAQRWINLGFLTIQPSELMKIATVLFLARYFSGSTTEDVKSPLYLILPTMLVFIPVGFVFLQPDLGTAITLLILTGGIYFLTGVSYWIFGVVIAGAVGLMPIIWAFLRDYQKQRIMVFLDPEKDPLGSGYHIIQSKIALGSGGIAGKGFLQGTQSRLNFLPEKQTDFIFTLFTEEWGFFGSFVLLCLFGSIIAYGYFISLRCQNQFGRLLAGGMVVNFFIYIFINVSMVMGLIPVVGVPLPFISYGGTVMLSVLIGFGLMMSAYVHRDIKFNKSGLGMA